MNKTPREEKNEGQTAQPARRGQGFWFVGLSLRDVVFAARNELKD